MQEKFASPHPSLQQYVRHYWSIEIGPDEKIPSQWIFPCINHDIIFQPGTSANYKNVGSSWAKREPTGFFEGHFDNPFVLDFSPGTCIYGIAFKPLGAFPFVRTSLNEFKNSFTGIDSIFGLTGSELIQQIQESKNIFEAAVFFNSFLLNLLKKDCCVSPHIRHTFQMLTESYSTIKIAKLPEMVYVSERKLQRDFKEQTGLSVERMAKLIRFRRTLQLLNYYNEKSLYEIGNEQGYYDTSHLLHDIRNKTGLPISAIHGSNTSIARALMSNDTA